MDSTSHPDYFRNIPEYSRRFLRGGDGYRRKCCGYIYYVKLVTDAAACKYLIGTVQTEAFGQKENTVRVNMGRKLSVLTNSVSLTQTDNGLGDNILFRLNDDWLFVPYEWSGPRIACAYADVI